MTYWYYIHSSIIPRSFDDGTHDFVCDLILHQFLYWLSLDMLYILFDVIWQPTHSTVVLAWADWRFLSINIYILIRLLRKYTCIVLPLLARIAVAPREMIQASCRLPGWILSSVVYRICIYQTHDLTVIKYRLANTKQIYIAYIQQHPMKAVNKLGNIWRHCGCCLSIHNY
jgi:hypothetical protein